MKNIVTFSARSDPRNRIPLGESVAMALRRFASTGAKSTVIAIVPTMLSFFGTSPDRYEVTEVTVIAEVSHE